MNHTVKLWVITGLLAICGIAAVVQHQFDTRREPGAPTELYEVVWTHINAYRAADYASAYQQVSTSFQEKFDIQSFSERARTEYPGLSRAERVEFGEISYDDEGRHAVMRAYFFLPEGDVIPCLYSLVHEGNVWKIDGTRFLRRLPAGRRLSGMRA
jgi:hypothetical protein